MKIYIKYFLKPKSILIWITLLVVLILFMCYLLESNPDDIDDLTELGKLRKNHVVLTK